MYPINDREYLKICAEIAQLMSISLSSAKKKVEMHISKIGAKTLEDKRDAAKEMFMVCQKNESEGIKSGRLFDDLMQSLANEDNFLTED